jgi:hypothetical protein
MFTDYSTGVLYRTSKFEKLWTLSSRLYILLFLLPISTEIGIDFPPNSIGTTDVEMNYVYPVPGHQYSKAIQIHARRSVGR